MRARKQGTIVNVASTAGFQAVPFMATYAATKAFVLSFSERYGKRIEDMESR
jgi:short-subunit dehydrogenase